MTAGSGCPSSRTDRVDRLDIRPSPRGGLGLGRGNRHVARRADDKARGCGRMDLADDPCRMPCIAVHAACKSRPPQGAARRPRADEPAHGSKSGSSTAFRTCCSRSAYSRHRRQIWFSSLRSIRCFRSFAWMIVGERRVGATLIAIGRHFSGRTDRQRRPGQGYDAGRHVGARAATAIALLLVRTRQSGGDMFARPRHRRRAFLAVAAPLALAFPTCRSNRPGSWQTSDRRADRSSMPRPGAPLHHGAASRHVLI